jgi:predicted RND superfamily exporter protein
LGEVMSVGIATCMIAGLTFLPALLNILTRWGWSLQKKKTQQR